MSTALSPVRLIRDRPTWLIYLLLSVFATFVYGLSAALPLLRADQGISATVAGLHGTSMAAGTIAAGLLLPLLTRTFGRRVTSWIGVAGLNAGMLTIFAADALPLTLLGYGVAGGFGSVMLYSAMAALSDHQGAAGAAALSEANAVAVVAGMAMTFGLSVVGQSSLGWRAALLATPVMSVLLALAMGRVWPGHRTPAAPPPIPPSLTPPSLTPPSLIPPSLIPPSLIPPPTLPPPPGPGWAGGSIWRGWCCSAAWRWSSRSTCGRRSCSPSAPGCPLPLRPPG
ncbi:MFS transporter [Nonomuraea thailandensis]